MLKGRASFVALGAGLGLVLVVGAAYLLGMTTAIAQPINQQHAQETKETKEAKEAKEEHLAAPGPMYSFKERVVNLTDPGGRRYLKVSMQIEFGIGAAEFRKASVEERKKLQGEFDKLLAPSTPLIEDAVITLISARASGDVQTTEGKQQLKTDIRNQINRLLGGEQVTNVYFTQFVMQ